MSAGVLVGVLELGRDRQHLALDEPAHGRDELVARISGSVVASWRGALRQQAAAGADRRTERRTRRYG